ncbi:Spastin [Parasponia andersonii]|uniref:Spastin n=1 Tax=Parasponia andersonii TaxID=3476 RepID=A0A2P5CEN4_PARAD|nr:Spastin [Parasponia andersonii]
MVTAIANFLDYNVYDLEHTAVKNNTDLRILLNDTSNKSIIAIEDIDCSLNITGQRNQKTKYDLDDLDESDHSDDDSDDSNEEEEQQRQHSNDKDGQKVMSKVTLSGLLNFIGGIWSACGGERLIVFTSNHVDKLDPALIRRGRMDKHTELSYSCFEGFKVLAKNYLGVASHDLFSTIERLLGCKSDHPSLIQTQIFGFRQAWVLNFGL